MERFGNVYAVTFDYGQRHHREIQSAKMICNFAGIEHEVIVLGESILKGSSPLIDPHAQLGQYEDHQSLPGGLGNGHPGSAYSLCRRQYVDYIKGMLEMATTMKSDSLGVWSGELGAGELSGAWR